MLVDQLGIVFAAGSVVDFVDAAQFQNQGTYTAPEQAPNNQAEPVQENEPAYQESAAPSGRPMTPSELQSQEAAYAA